MKRMLTLLMATVATILGCSRQQEIDDVAIIADKVFYDVSSQPLSMEIPVYTSCDDWMISDKIPGIADCEKKGDGIVVNAEANGQGTRDILLKLIANRSYDTSNGISYTPVCDICIRQRGSHTRYIPLKDMSKLGKRGDGYDWTQTESHVYALGRIKCLGIPGSGDGKYRCCDVAIEDDGLNVLTMKFLCYHPAEIEYFKGFQIGDTVEIGLGGLTISDLDYAQSLCRMARIE